MRLMFSECRPQYSSYLSPYQIWGVLEDGETAADAFSRGFLPAAADLSRFSLARSVRIDLDAFGDSRRIRHMARRCADLTPVMIPIAEFDFNDDWRRLAKKYLSERHPGSPFTLDRFTRQLRTRLTTHVLTLTTPDGRPAALAALYLEPGLLYYAAAVYDLDRLSSSLGGHVMASALGQAKRALYDFAYLGTCYSFGALYKTRFTGMQFFNGRHWSADRSELTFLLEHQDQLHDTHLLAYPPYAAAFPQVADELIF